MAALAAKSYITTGQAAFALHEMAILQIHQVKAHRELHQGSSEPEMMQELHTATN